MKFKRKRKYLKIVNFKLVLLHPITPFSIMCKEAMCRGPFSCRLSIVELLSLSWGLRPEQHKDTFLEMLSGQFSFSNPPNHAKMQYIVVLLFFIVYMWSSKVRGTVKYFGRKVGTSFCVNTILQSFRIKWSEYFLTKNLRFLHFSSYFLKRAQRFLKTSQIHLT